MPFGCVCALGGQQPLHDGEPGSVEELRLGKRLIGDKAVVAGVKLELVELGFERITVFIAHLAVIVDGNVIKGGRLLRFVLDRYDFGALLKQTTRLVPEPARLISSPMCLAAI